MSAGSLPLEEQERIDEICLSFEIALAEQRESNLEYFLSMATPLARPVLLSELLRLEVDYAQRRHGSITPEPYLARFPADAQIVYDVFRWATAPPCRDEPPNPDATRRFSKSEPRTGTGSQHPASQNDDLDHRWNRLQPGECLNRFEIREVIGRGSFGTVYRAYDPRLERDVAIKVPRFKPADCEFEGQRFVREARAAARFRHINFCPLYEMDFLEDSIYLVMPFLEGISLKDRLKIQPRLSDEQSISLVEKLALALAAAHQTGLIHRDLKPANIMLDSSGEPVLMDFGLALRSGDVRLTRAGDIFGTPAYMCPEQAQGQTKDVGVVADIYSLGSILFELLAGKRAYQGTFAEVLKQITSSPIPTLSTLRPDLPLLDDFCARAMAKDPADRFQSMDEFAVTLESCLPVKASAKAAARLDVWPAVDVNAPAGDLTMRVRVGDVVLLQLRHPRLPAMPKSATVSTEQDRVRLVATAKSGAEVALSPTAHEAPDRTTSYVQFWVRPTEPGNETLRAHLTFLDGRTKEVPFKLEIVPDV